MSAIICRERIFLFGLWVGVVVLMLTSCTGPSAVTGGGEPVGADAMSDDASSQDLPGISDEEIAIRIETAWDREAARLGLIGKTFVFDDMHYPAGLDSLVNPVDWFVLRNGKIETEKSQGWYVDSWQERPIRTPTLFADADSHFVYRSGPERMVIKVHAGEEVDRVWRLASGSASTSGTWVARMRLSPLPPRSEVAAHYSFWVRSPVDQMAGKYPFFNVGEGKRWSEVNTEIVNWFDNSKAGDDNFYRRVSSGTTWAPYNSTTPASTQTSKANCGGAHCGDVFYRGYTGDPRGSCRLQAIDRGRHRVVPASLDDSPNYCRDIVTRALRTEELDVYRHDDLWTYILIHVTDRTVYQVVLAGDESAYGRNVSTVEGLNWVEMSARGFTQRVPPDPLTTMFTVGATRISEGGMQDSLALEIDWTYFSPDTSLSIWDVRADVAKIRRFTRAADGTRLWRLSTVEDLSVEAPVERGGRCQVGEQRNHSMTGLDLDLEHYAAPELGPGGHVFRLRLVRDVARGVDLRQTTFNVEWVASASYSRSGRADTVIVSSEDDVGFRYEFVPRRSVGQHRRITFDVKLEDRYYLCENRGAERTFVFDFGD